MEGKRDAMKNLRVLQESLIRFRDAPKLPGMKRVSTATVYRWADEGRRVAETGEMVTLEWCYYLGGRATSLEALERFWIRVNGGG